MTNTKEKNKKFNFIDVILLIIILTIFSALIYLLISAYNTHFLKDAANTAIEYTVVVENVDNAVNCDKIKEGDSVTELDTLSKIGKVVSVDETPSLFVAPDSEGKAVESEHPTKKDVTLVISAEGDGSGTTYDLGSYTVSVGKDVRFRVPGFTGEGRCVSVEVTDGE